MGFIKPLINGYLFQFSSIILTVDGKPMQGITAVNYDSSSEQSMFYGNSKTPVAMTKGTASSTGSLTIPATLRDAFLALVTKGGTRGMFDTPFTVTVSYAEEGNPVTTDILEGCRVSRMSAAHSQGSEPLSVDIELAVPTIIYGNGRFRAYTDAV